VRDDHGCTGDGRSDTYLTDDIATLSYTAHCRVPVVAVDEGKWKFVRNQAGAPLDLLSSLGPVTQP